MASYYCRTLSLWILLLLGLLGIQFAIDKTVKNYFGQAYTGILMIIIITIKYNPIDFFFQLKTTKTKQEKTRLKVEKDEKCSQPESSSSLEKEPADPAEALAQNVHVSSRIIFLDNLKSFLTMLVVTLHVNCAFGGCKDFWFLIIGEESSPPLFFEVVRQLSMLLQGFFMPLFFFVSAYFVPISYHARTPKAFFQGKRRRLYFSAMFVIFILTPLCAAIGHWMAARDNSKSKASYLFIPGHVWFNLWLLALHWVYATFMVAITKDAQRRKNDESTSLNENKKEEEAETRKQNRIFPSTWKRMTSSLLICGGLLIPFLALTGPVTFAGMPMMNGSFTCDFFMYAMGILAQNHGWLEKPLKDQMDITPWMQRLILLTETLAIVMLYHLHGIEESKNAITTGFFLLVGGMYTVDMGLALVEFFQDSTWLNTDNKYSRFFSRASYTVYLIHPLVIVTVSALYLKFPFADDITFANSNSAEKFLNVLAPPGQGAEEYYLSGWCIVFVLSQLIVWPLAYCIASAPYLRNFL